MDIDVQGSSSVLNTPNALTINTRFDTPEKDFAAAVQNLDVPLDAMDETPGTPDPPGTPIEGERLCSLHRIANLTST